MGTITRMHEHLRPLPARITTEEDVLSIAADLYGHAPGADAADDHTSLSRSGLLAISMPYEFGGLDVSNVVLAKLIAVVAETSTAAARRLASHFVALELVRNGGSEEQQRSVYARPLAGEQIALLIPETSTQTPVYQNDGLGFQLSGTLKAAAPLDAAWLATRALNTRGQASLLLLPQLSTGITADPGALETAPLVQFTQAHVAADAVLDLHENAEVTAQALSDLLDAAVIVGHKQRLVKNKLAALSDRLATSTTEFEIGAQDVETEILLALIQRCGSAIDAAQVSPSPETLSAAGRIASALSVAVVSVSIARNPDKEKIAALGRQVIAAQTPIH